MCWYYSHKLNKDNARGLQWYNWGNVINIFHKISSVLEEESMYNYNDNSKIFLGGFGQGVALSFYLMVSSNFGGVISLSGTLFHYLPVNIVKERKKSKYFYWTWY